QTFATQTRITSSVYRKLIVISSRLPRRLQPLHHSVWDYSLTCQLPLRRVWDSMHTLRIQLLVTMVQVLYHMRSPSQLCSWKALYSWLSLYSGCGNGLLVLFQHQSSLLLVWALGCT